MLYSDLSGKKYGNLTVINFVERKRNKKTYWNCECYCGNKIVTSNKFLKNNKNVIDCGCSLKEKLAEKSHPAYGLYKTYRTSASTRDLSFDLPFEIFTYITSDNCFYCNKVPSKICKNGYKYNGVDRIKNDIGYEFQNVITCCTICNKMKSDKTYEEFLEHIYKVFNHYSTIDLDYKSTGRTYNTFNSKKLTNEEIKEKMKMFKILINLDVDTLVGMVNNNIKEKRTTENSK